MKWGNANTDITLKGKLKYKDVNILLIKNPGTEWIVDKTEE